MLTTPPLLLRSSGPSSYFRLSRKNAASFSKGILSIWSYGSAWSAPCTMTSSLATDVAALQNDVAGIDGNLTTAASVAVVENTVTTAIDDLDELAEVEF